MSDGRGWGSPVRPSGVDGQGAPGFVPLFLLLALVALGSPGAGQEIPPDRVVNGVPVCSDCEIRITSRAVLGSEEDAAGPVGRVQVVMGGGGEFLVVSDHLPLPGVLAYGPDGGFRGVRGREGQGPGEFGRPWRLGGAPDGTVYVFDQFQASVHVFAPEGSWSRTLRPVVSPLHGPLPVSDSILVVVPGGARPPEAPDREIVLYHQRTGAVLGGISPTGAFVPGQPTRISSVAAAHDGSIWVGRGGTGVIERWDLSGRLRTRLEWEEGWARHARPDRRTAAFLAAHLWQDPETGLLWVVSNSPDPSYVAPPVTRPQPGQPLPEGILDPSSLNARHRPIVSVLDPNTGEVIAHRMIDRYVHTVLVDGRLVVMNESASGHQWVEILQLELAGFR